MWRHLAGLLLANITSFGWDFVFRQKPSGLNASFYFMRQSVGLPPDTYARRPEWAASILYLPSTPEGDWKPARKAEGAVVDETPEQLIELKKYFPTPRDAVAYIMETFPIVKRKDIGKYATYPTKDTILEICDEMQVVMTANSAAVAAGRPPATRPASTHPRLLHRCRWQLHPQIPVGRCYPATLQRRHPPTEAGGD